MRDTKRQARRLSLPAPMRGLVENAATSTMDPLGAEWVENWIPTERGLRVRGGTVQFSNVDVPVRALFDYEAGIYSRLFAATDTDIFDVLTSVSSQVVSETLVWGEADWGQAEWGAQQLPLVSGLHSGNWAYQQIGTSGGDFLIAVNGSDLALLYDGSDWSPLTDEAVNVLNFDGMSAAFTTGETVTGGTSGASAEILGFVQTSASTGKLFLGAITSGPFVNNEALTSAAGVATADGVTSVLNAVTITGVATSSLSDVWLYGGRLFFVEKDSLKAWYLPAGAIGGAAGDISLAGVFQRGGRLLMGGSWSSDSGDGLDDRCVFISDKGEVAIYYGTDPSDATTWALQGRYDIGKPLGKRGTIQAGGDLLVATDDGIVPISAAVQQDRAVLSLSAVTNPIRTTWRDEVLSSQGNVELLKWTRGNLLFAVFPGSDRMLTANLQTGAWAVQTGWNGNCAATFGDGVFVGRQDGTIVKLDEGGSDLGQAYTARVSWPFLDMGDATAYKSATMARGSYFADNQFTAKYSAATDYSLKFPTAPSAAAPNVIESVGLIWGFGNWGERQWLREVSSPRQGRVDNWKSIAGTGYAISPQVQITSGSVAAMSVELVSMDILYEGGGRAS